MVSGDGDDACPCDQSLYVYGGYQKLEIVQVGRNVMPCGDEIASEEHLLSLELASQNPEPIFLSLFKIVQ